MDDKTKNDIISESLYNNYLKEATSTSTDVGQFGQLILPLVQKIYPQSLVNQIASVQPTKSPVAKIAALYSIYTGAGSNNDNGIHIDAGATWTGSKIITVAASAGALITVGSSGVSGTNKITVFYKETASAGPINHSAPTSAFPYTDYTHLLVRVDSGDINTGGTFTINAVSGVSILYASQNRNIIKRVFKDYSDGLEDNSDLRDVNFEIRTSTINCNTRKIRTKYTQENIKDLETIYGTKTNDIVADYIANEISQEIDREVIQYLKDIATPMPTDIDLTKSFANAQSGSIGDMTYDLYFTVFTMIEEIVRATKRNRTMFILADSTTTALLVSNALHSSVEPDKSNPYRVGSVGPYPLFADPYSTEHYIMVGYRFESNSKDDAGLIFSPYLSTIVETQNADTLQQVYMTLNRYAFTRHPQDAGTGYGDSDFFRYVAVNYGTTLTVGTPTGGANMATQVRAFY